MKLSKKFWFRLHDNIIAILFLSIFQIWMIITFPGHAFLGTAANIVMRFIYGIIGIFCLFWLFIYCDNKEGALFFSNDSLRFKEPLRTYMRWFRITIFIGIFSSATYYGYNNGFFNYSKLYYGMMYANGILLYYFLYQAAQKNK